MGQSHTTNNYSINININRSLQLEPINVDQSGFRSTRPQQKQLHLRKKLLNEDADELIRWEEKSSETSQERIERLK